MSILSCASATPGLFTQSKQSILMRLAHLKLRVVVQFYIEFIMCRSVFHGVISFAACLDVSIKLAEEANGHERSSLKL